MPKEARFFVDATQTAYLWSHRKLYGTRSSAIRALRKRRSATGKTLADCENAFEVGLAVVAATARGVSKVPDLPYLSRVDSIRTAERIAAKVRRAVSTSTSEMVDYAMGMLFWMPIMR
jgi:hypothetical protein